MHINFNVRATGDQKFEEGAEDGCWIQEWFVYTRFNTRSTKTFPFKEMRLYQK